VPFAALYVVVITFSRGFDPFCAWNRSLPSRGEDLAGKIPNPKLNHLTHRTKKPNDAAPQGTVLFLEVSADCRQAQGLILPGYC